MRIYVYNCLTMMDIASRNTTRFYLMQLMLSCQVSSCLLYIHIILRHGYK